ncbi:MAG: c-type cytochrome [Candidatus Sulfotelmatobacter sp.]
MSRELKIGLAVLLLGGALVLFAGLLHGPGAREAPSASEAAVARRLRVWAIPRSAREGKNPFGGSQELLKESARHFADHCASCHGNDGSGATEMGRNLFPRVPDMRLDATQRLSDGELYYIIHNGIRWTGMPAWGDADNDMDSWKLVIFVRHLPQLSQDEIRDMERYNPGSVADQEEEKEEEEFLNGGQAPANSSPREPHSEKTK